MIFPSELEDYLAKGWILGDPKEFHMKNHIPTEEERKRTSERFKGTHFSESHKINHEKAMRKAQGVKIEKDGEIFYSWKYELSSYLEQGWKLVE